MMESSDGSTTTTTTTNKEWSDAVYQYYNLKRKYQEKNDDMKHTVLQIPRLSWREKRRLWKTIEKRCIHCNALGGTVFHEGLDEPLGERVLKASCGNRAKPCPLHIEIPLGVFLKMDESLRDDQDILEEYKNKLIRGKNNLLFGYSTTEKALADFDEIKDQIAEVSEVYEYELIKHEINQGDDYATRKKLQTMEERIYKDMEVVRKTIGDFERTHNTVFIQDVVQFYNQELYKNIVQYRQMKYPVCFVDYHEDDNTHHLIQQRYSQEKMEENFGKPLHVVKMVLTIREPSSTATKTVKKRNASKNKTRKRIPSPIQEEPEAEAEEAKAEEAEEAEEVEEAEAEEPEEAEDESE